MRAGEPSVLSESYDLGSFGRASDAFPSAWRKSTSDNFCWLFEFIEMDERKELYTKVSLEWYNDRHGVFVITTKVQINTTAGVA